MTSSCFILSPVLCCLYYSRNTAVLLASLKAFYYRVDPVQELADRLLSSWVQQQGDSVS